MYHYGGYDVIGELVRCVEDCDIALEAHSYRCSVHESARRNVNARYASIIGSYDDSEFDMRINASYPECWRNVSLNNSFPTPPAMPLMSDTFDQKIHRVKELRSWAIECNYIKVSVKDVLIVANEVLDVFNRYRHDYEEKSKLWRQPDGTPLPMSEIAKKLKSLSKSEPPRPLNDVYFPQLVQATNKLRYNSKLADMTYTKLASNEPIKHEIIDLLKGMHEFATKGSWDLDFDYRVREDIGRFWDRVLYFDPKWTGIEPDSSLRAGHYTAVEKPKMNDAPIDGSTASRVSDEDIPKESPLATVPSDVIGATVVEPPKSPPVVLGAPSEPVIVLGRKKPRLTRARYRVIQSLCDTFPNRIKLDVLRKKCNTESPHKTLKDIAKLDNDWAAVISFPSQEGYGEGYGLVCPKDVPQVPT